MAVRKAIDLLLVRNTLAKQYGARLVPCLLEMGSMYGLDKKRRLVVMADALGEKEKGRMSFMATREAVDAIYARSKKNIDVVEKCLRVFAKQDRLEEHDAHHAASMVEDVGHEARPEPYFYLVLIHLMTKSIKDADYEKERFVTGGKQGRRWLRGEDDACPTDSAMEKAMEAFKKFIELKKTHENCMNWKRMRRKRTLMQVDLHLTLARAHLARFEHRQAHGHLVSISNTLDLLQNVRDYRGGRHASLEMRRERFREFVRLWLMLAWRTNRYFTQLYGVLQRVFGLPHGLVPRSLEGIVKETMDVCFSRGARPFDSRVFEWSNGDMRYKRSEERWDHLPPLVREAYIVLDDLWRLAIEHASVANDARPLWKVMVAHNLTHASKIGKMDVVKSWWVVLKDDDWARPLMWANWIKVHRHCNQFDQGVHHWDVAKIELQRFVNAVTSDANNMIAKVEVVRWQRVWSEGVALYAHRVEPDIAETLFGEALQWLKTIQGVMEAKGISSSGLHDTDMPWERLHLLYAWCVAGNIEKAKQWYDACIPYWSHRERAYGETLLSKMAFVSTGEYEATLNQTGRNTFKIDENRHRNRMHPAAFAMTLSLLYRSKNYADVLAAFMQTGIPHYVKWSNYGTTEEIPFDLYLRACAQLPERFSDADALWQYYISLDMPIPRSTWIAWITLLSAANRMTHIEALVGSKDATEWHRSVWVHALASLLAVGRDTAVLHALHRLASHPSQPFQPPITPEDIVQVADQLASAVTWVQ